MDEFKQKGIILKENLMQSIRDGKITQHSHWYFVIRVVLWLVATLLLLSLTIYLVSFVFFSLQANGIFLLSPFGMFGILTILYEMPWFLIGVCLFGLVATLSIARTTALVYRTPMLYLFLLAIGIVGILSLIVSVTKVHPYFFNHAKAYPKVRTLYMHYANPEGRRITVGHVIGTTTDGEFIVKNRNSDFVNVAINSNTQFVTLDVIGIDDVILVVGDLKQGKIKADALRKITKMDKDNLFEESPEEKHLLKREKSLPDNQKSWPKDKK